METTLLPAVGTTYYKEHTMSNRRDYERMLIRKFALIKLASGETIEGQTRDLSEAGAFVECTPSVSVPEGTACTIQLALDENNSEQTTDIQGSISHSENDGLGLKFLLINATYYQFIRELID